jgi:multidrug efflux pump subunit AcrA (membrane-fusion protein)
MWITLLKRPTLWLSLAGIFLAVRLVAASQKPIPNAPPFREPTTAPFENAIGARGIVESRERNVRVAPALPGLVRRVAVEVGQEVKAGDVLVEQDVRDPQALVASQEAEVKTLEAQLDETQVLLADRMDALGRVQRLTAKNVASDDERQRADFQAKLASAAVASMRAKLAQTQTMVSKSKVSLDLLTTRAPSSGRVLQVNTREGEYVTSSAVEPMILLGEVNKLHLRADVDEDNATRVVENCQAVAYPKGRRDVRIDLRFVRIEPYIVPKRSLAGDSSERVDTRVLQVIFEFDRPNVPIYVGQQLDVFLQGAVRTEGK